MKHFVVLTLILIFVAMLLRKHDKIIKLSQLTTDTFRKIWLGLVTV